MAGERKLDVTEAGRLGGEETRLRYGPEHFRRIGRLGGEALAADREHMSRIGKKGGESISRDREHMSQIGERGSQVVRQRYGEDYYSAIGRLGAQKRWEKEREKEKEQGSSE